MAIKDLLIKNLEAWDDSRARSQQVEVGASQLGGCRRQVWLHMDGAPKINKTERLPALMGTAIHDMIERSFRIADPDGIRFLLEVTVPGLPEIGLGPAHVDCYDGLDQAIIDWKSITLRNVKWFPKQKQWWQVMVYADRMIAAGYPVQTVTLVGIPRDGTAEDIVEETRDYFPAEAALAKAWLAELHGWDRSTGLPPADLSGKICSDYCHFFGESICLGKPGF